jgi:Eukaryotic cytochrome b561
MIDWLLMPLSGAGSNELSPLIAWHARLMVLAWGVIAPCAVLIARYWKIWPSQRWPQELDHKAWWHSHRFGQGAAVALMLIGAYLGWRGSGQPTSRMLSLHASLGWLLVLLGGLQILGAWLRGSKGGPTEASLRGDHFDMTQRRRVFERTHKGLGWFALALACVTILLGLMLADAPRWMLLSLLAWWIALILVGWRWQTQAKCIDTYQAIWGADPNLPGLRFAPIGFGVRRVHASNNKTDSPQP